MAGMKITGYMLLTPDLIAYDPEERTVHLAKEARFYGRMVFPTFELAATPTARGEQIYAVQAEVPNDTVFEVRGDIDMSEGRGGTYIAGIFANYGDAFLAAEGLGAQGRRGYLNLKLGIERIYTSYADWKKEFNPAEARNAPQGNERTDLLSIVDLAPRDAAALGAADPEYAVWLRLNEKFGKK